MGLEAQRRTTDAFAKSRGTDVLARFLEVESGCNANRPEQAKALHHAKLNGATLVIAKLDLQGRNAAFLLTLRASGVRILAVDMPEANNLPVGIMARVALAEREAISRRTKEVLAVARARGVKLGNPSGALSLRPAGKSGVALRGAVSANADSFAADIAPVLTYLLVAGHVSLRSIAAKLTAQGIRTRRGGVWRGGM